MARPPRLRKTPEDAAHHLDVQRRNKTLPPRRESATVRSVLKETLKDVGLVSRLKFRALHQAWALALAQTPDDLRHTRLVKSRAGVLTIEVDSAARLNDFVRYRKLALITALNAILQGRPPVLDLEFVLGHFPAPAPASPSEPIP